MQKKGAAQARAACMGSAIIVTMTKVLLVLAKARRNWWCYNHVCIQKGGGTLRHLCAAVPSTREGNGNEPFETHAKNKKRKKKQKSGEKKRGGTIS